MKAPPPRMGAMRELVPDLDVRIVTSQNEFDIRGEQVDLAIAFGAGLWPGCKVDLLFPEIVIPVCSPAFFAARIKTRRKPDLAQLPLLHLESDEPARWLTWDKWFGLQGKPSPAGGHDMRFNNYPLVMQAAIAGQGVALGWVPLIDDLLQGGQLVTAVARPTKTERGCFLVQPNSRKNLESIDRFQEWIKGECERVLKQSTFYSG